MPCIPERTRAREALSAGMPDPTGPLGSSPERRPTAEPSSEPRRAYEERALVSVVRRPAECGCRRTYEGLKRTARSERWKTGPTQRMQPRRTPGPRAIAIGPERGIHDQTISSPGQGDIEKALTLSQVLFSPERLSIPSLALDHPLWRWAGLTFHGARQCVLIEARHVNHRELQTLGTMDCHESDGIDALSRQGQLSQVSIVAQEQETSYSFQQPSNRQSLTWGLDSCEVEQLPSCNALGGVSNILGCCQAGEDPCLV